MKFKNIIKSFVLSLLLLIGLTNCSGFLSEYSQDMVIAKHVEDFDELLLGACYIPSVQQEYGETGTACGGFFNILDDDVNTGRGAGIVGQNTTSRAWLNSVSPTFGYFAWQLEVGKNYSGTITNGDNVTWDDLYKRINTINVILDEIKDIPHTTTDEDAAWWRVQGEAHFLRGCFYFILANLYGDAYSPSTASSALSVPLKLTAYVEHDKNKPTQFERATAKEVYNQIIEDLKTADEYLTKSPQIDTHRLYRASAEAAEVLLSRVYLYMQDWSNAELMADKALKSKHNSLAGLSLLGKGVTFLTSDNPEIIFSQGSNYLAPPEIFTGGAGDFCVASELYNLYDKENDKRWETFFSVNSTTDSIALANKYEKGLLRARVSDAFSIRMAEAYLNKAEACAMQSGKEAEACQYLNQLRRQRIVGYEDKTYSGRQLVDEIRLERRKELCFEGQRWFDLRRYAVNESYPYKRQIVHVFNACGDEIDFIASRTYILKENDFAYTFAIPKTTMDFDKVPMKDNPREKRDYLKDNNNKEE